MQSQAKALSAGSTLGTGKLIGLLVLAGAAFLAFASPALGASCPNEAIREQQHLTSQPGCRGYELVTPLNKNGGAPGEPAVIDNDHVFMSATSAFLDDDPGIATVGFYLGTRSPERWGLKAGVRAASSLTGAGTVVVDYNRDFSQEIVRGVLPLLSADQDDRGDVYAKTAEGLTLVSQGSLGQGDSTVSAYYAGQSPDGRHILFETRNQLEPADSGRDPAALQLYERVGGQTRVVALDTDGDPIGTGGAVLGAGAQEGWSVGSSNAVSADGSRIFFTAPCPYGQTAGGFEGQCQPAGDDPSQVYAREDGKTTVMVSASERTLPGNGVWSAEFQGAAADGSRVFFGTPAQLVDSDTDESYDLYQYDFDAPEGNRLTRLSGGTSGDVLNAEFANVVAISDDGMYVYFQALGPVAPDATPGSANVFVYDGHTETARWVAPLPSNNGSWTPFGYLFPTSAASLSNDGKTLLLLTAERLTAFDNAGFQEVYRYQIDTNEITCPSCNHMGRPPIGDAKMDARQSAFGGSPAISSKVNRFVNDDGSVVVFHTADALVAKDTNFNDDVYLWENGTVSLLTSGIGPGGSRAGGLTPDGRDIFFITYDQLVPADIDAYADLYDARIDGGFLEDQSGIPCSADSCQDVYSVGTGASMIGSLAYAGAGDTLKSRSAPSIEVFKAKRVINTVATVKVRVPTAGEVVISGSQVNTSRRAVTAPGTYRFRTSLTHQATKRLSNQKTLTATVLVVFKGRNGNKASKRVTLTFKRPEKATRSHRPYNLLGGR